MQANEWTKLVEIIAVQFPSVFTWIQSLPNPGGTLAHWANVLAKIEYAEAIEVLAGWSSGKYPAPVKYQWDDWALHVKQSVMRIRSDKHRFDLKETVRKPTREEYARNRDLNLVESFALVKALADEWKLGGMSEDEWQRRKMEIVRGVK